MKKSVKYNLVKEGENTIRVLKKLPIKIVKHNNNNNQNDNDAAAMIFFAFISSYMKFIYSSFHLQLSFPDTLRTTLIT